MRLTAVLVGLCATFVLLEGVLWGAHLVFDPGRRAAASE